MADDRALEPACERFSSCQTRSIRSFRRHHLLVSAQFGTVFSTLFRHIRFQSYPVSSGKLPQTQALT